MSNGPDRSQQTQIIIAVLGFLGVVVAALISSGALNKLFSSPTPSQPPTVVVVVTATTAPDVVIRPTITATVPPPEVTPTVASPVDVPTNTLEPTLEPTVVPTQIPGADWATGCISGSTWKAYPDSLNQLDQKGCITEPVGNLFRSSDGHLNLLYNDRFEGANVYGLFTSLPQEGTVNLTINLKDFNNNFLGDIWLGVFSKPTIESDGMLVVIPAGNIDKASATTKFVFVQKEMPSRKKLQGTDYFTLSPALYKIVFDLNKASVHTKIDTAYPWAEYPTSFTEKWLFIGYETKNGTNKLQADFYNLTIQAK